MKQINKKSNKIKKGYYLAFAIIFLSLIPFISAGAVFPEPDNITTPLQSIAYINQLTDVGSGPMLGTIIYFLMVAVLFMGMKSYTNERAAAASLFISSIIGILLRIFGWINDTGVYISLILMIIAIFQLWRKND